MINTKRSIVEAVVISTVLTAILILLTQVFTDAKFNILEALSVYFTFACTWLCTRQVRFNYVFGMIGTSFLVITFAQANLYGSMALNIYLVPTVIYGWFVWGKDTSPKPVEHVKAKALPVYLLVTGVTWLGAYFIITQFGGKVAPLDGLILVGSIFAQYLMDRKKLENWMVWIAVNIISIYVYFQAELYLLCFQFALFIVNAIIAHVVWARSMNANKRLEDQKESVLA